MATLSIARADELTPDTVRNQIVRGLAQVETRGPSIDDVIPTMMLSDSEVDYYRRNGYVLPMKRASISSESPTAEFEDMDRDTMNVDTFKRKLAPERGVDFELNTYQQLMDVFDTAVTDLRRSLRLTRELAGWQGLDGINGFIGEDGATAHPDLDTSHVLTPGTAFSDTANSTPQDTFTQADFLIDDEGTMLDEMPEPTAYISPSLERDLKQNDDLESRFSGVAVQGLTMEQVANVLPVENIEVVYTRTVRTNENGEPLDENGNVVSDRDNAALDNVLEPYDEGASSQRRNIVIGTAGTEDAAAMPVLTDRLAEFVGSAAQDPMGDYSVDTSVGFVMQMWTETDPPVSWFKVAQEFGVELVRPENWVVIQDV